MNKSTEHAFYKDYQEYLDELNDNKSKINIRLLMKYKNDDFSAHVMNRKSHKKTRIHTPFKQWIESHERDLNEQFTINMLNNQQCK